MDFNSFSANSTTLSSSSANFSTTLSILHKKEHMFDKVVTPSDVGKLNRLVIPKQHAQKYFPLDLDLDLDLDHHMRTSSSSSSETTTSWNLLHSHSSDKDQIKLQGLLLNFEEADRTDGKTWRFRYSYWSSSQSYVITKGWSRFVKDKKLNSGDLISFYRSKDRLFIDWRYQIHPHHQLPNFYYLNIINPQRHCHSWSCTTTTTTAAPAPLFSSNLYYFNHQVEAMQDHHHSVSAPRPLLVDGGYGGAYHEPAGRADQGILMNTRSEAQPHDETHHVIMGDSTTTGIMSTRSRTSADIDDHEEEEEAIHDDDDDQLMLDSEAAPLHRAGEMKQLRLFGVNMKCADPHPAGS